MIKIHCLRCKKFNDNQNPTLSQTTIRLCLTAKKDLLGNTLLSSLCSETPLSKV